MLLCIHSLEYVIVEIYNISLFYEVFFTKSYRFTTFDKYACKNTQVVNRLIYAHSFGEFVYVLKMIFFICFTAYIEENVLLSCLSRPKAILINRKVQNLIKKRLI